MDKNARVEKETIETGRRSFVLETGTAEIRLSRSERRSLHFAHRDKRVMVFLRVRF